MQKVRVEYTSAEECGPTKMYNPYSPMTMVVEGDIETVANWIDENLIAGHITLSGIDTYVQGESKAWLLRSLAKGGHFDVGAVSFTATLLSPKPQVYYEVGLCNGINGPVSEIIGPFMSEEAAMKEANERNAELGSPLSDQYWAWGPINTLKRAKNCIDRVNN